MLQFIAYRFREDVRRFKHTIEIANAHANLRNHHDLSLR